MPLLESLSARDRRALILGAMIAVPVVGYLSVVRPYLRSEASARDAIAAARDLLARETDVVGHASELQPEISRGSSTVMAASRRLYDAREPVAATAALARDVRTALDRAHVATQRLESREATM